ncbi:hypothetical protein FHS83_003156 [Rhizomicrobium palustre]|uniref:Calcium-binding protein n=1 Tax=Rhizomicrobium palustre TaxID=189966 RepID=A0A846N1L6_9PROT|nr:hypothetical protein [Rhizomicrobium palustre]NIK89838.1 hypothetical protein [Rhizomicrobium palustre]
MKHALLMSTALAAATGLLALPAAAQTVRAQDFVDAIGVNVHVAYTDGAYGKLDKVTQSLDYLGIKLLRDSAPNTQNLPRYNTLANAGYRFNFIVNGGDTGILAQRFAGITTSYPGSVVAVEGPNEVNNFKFTYAGQTGTTAALAYQTQLFNSVKATPALSATNVYNYTDYPYHAGTADSMNIHTYPKYGAQPYASLVFDLNSVTTALPGHPRVITEIGYPQMPDPKQWKGPADWNPVDENTQAILTLNALLDAYTLGAQKIYLYQLLEAYADTQNKDYDTRLGLFDVNYRPKMAATAVRNFLNLLRDSNAAARSFTPRATPASVINLPVTARSLVLQRADGSDVVVVWNEAQLWDRASRAAVSPAATKVTLASTNLRDAAVYDPVKSATPLTSYKAAASVELSLAADPLVIVLAPR